MLAVPIDCLSVFNEAREHAGFSPFVAETLEEQKLLTDDEEYVDSVCKTMTEVSESFFGL